MSNFKHENIVCLIGICFDSDTISLIMEHMEAGDLLSYLRAARPSSQVSELLKYHNGTFGSSHWLHPLAAPIGSLTMKDIKMALVKFPLAHSSSSISAAALL